MTNRFDVLTLQLFQKNIIDCSVEELQNLADENPYFAPAQYALLTKLKEKDHDKYQAQFQKAILYYHDPLTFDQFINEENYSFDFATVDEQEVVLPVESEKELDIQENSNSANTEEIEQTLSKEFQETENHFIELSREDEIVTEEAPREINNERVEQETILEEQPTIPVVSTENSKPDESLVFEPYH